MKCHVVGAGRRYLWVFLVLTIGLAFARADDTALTFTTSSLSVPAGSKTKLWLNALNISRREVLWPFPSTIQVRAVSRATTNDDVIQLQTDGQMLKATIEPGGYARRGYVFTVPAEAAGQLVIEFPQLNASPLVLSVGAPLSAVEGTSEAAEKADTFERLIKHPEPLSPSGGYEPSRFFKDHISGHEPFYFIAGTESPNAKFQISFKYQLLKNDGPLATHVPALKGLHVAYTQTSLWDWNSPSAPFFDTSYKPAFLYNWERIVGRDPTNWFRLDIQGGFQHESNGKDNGDSRSMNIAYLRPTVIFGKEDGLQLTLQPRAWFYLGELNDNPDLTDYRGYADLRAIIGWSRGLQLSAYGRIGDDGNHPSLQFDLTYPLMRVVGSFSVYFQVQYFTGYGETLLHYKDKSSSIRAGFALYR